MLPLAVAPLEPGVNPAGLPFVRAIQSSNTRPSAGTIKTIVPAHMIAPAAR